MLHQQINDLAIIDHNWLWNKGYNILSISLQLFNTHSCTVLLVLPDNSTCPLFGPSCYSPLPSLFPLRMSLERTTAPSFPLSLERGIWKPGSVSATLHHIQSSPCLFSSPTFPPSPPPPFLPSFCPTAFLLMLTTCLFLVSVLNHSIYYHSPASFHYYLSLSNCFPLRINSVFVLEDALSFKLYEDGGCIGKPVHPCL